MRSLKFSFLLSINVSGQDGVEIMRVSSIIRVQLYFELINGQPCVVDVEHKGVRLFLLVVAIVCERTTCRLVSFGDGNLQSRMFNVTYMDDLSYNVLHGPLSSMT